MKKLLILLLATILPLAVLAQKGKIKKANEDTASWRYEIDNMGVGTRGSVVVKVWSYSKKTNVAAEQAKKNAVHGVVFKGVPAKDRMPGKKALVDAATHAQHEAFFDTFFADGGDYAKFVTLTTNGAIGAGDIQKVSKKEYKVGIVVNVNYDELKAYLQDQGLVKRLSSGF